MFLKIRMLTRKLLLMLFVELVSLPVRSQSQVDVAPLFGDSTKSVLLLSDTLGFRDFIKSFALQSFKAPFDLKAKHPENIALKDSLKNWKQYLPSVHGQVSMGYDAGQLPNYFIPDEQRPMHLFHTEGNVNTALIGLPMRVSWRYATIKNPIGINNFFRFSFDTERFKQLPNLNQQAVNAQVSKQLDQIKEKTGQLNGKLGYAELLREQLKLQLQRTLEVQAQRLQEIAVEQAKAQQQALELRLRDSLANNGNLSDSLAATYQEKREQLAAAQQKVAKLQADYEKAKTQIELLQQSADTVQYYVHQFTQLRNQLDSTQAEILDQKAQWQQLSKEAALKQLKTLGLFKKLDFGLTYPNTSALTKNSIPVKGLDFEIQKGKMYYSFTAGVTMNNLMVTNNALQNSLQNSFNLFNQFDFQSIREKRLLAMAKSGYGTKDGTHAFLGLRYMNKAIPNDTYQADSSNVAGAAFGFELDLRWVPKRIKGMSLDVVYGKTSRGYDPKDSTQRSAVTSLFSTDRTHTALARLTQQVKALRSSFIGTFRYLDAFADMASMGVLQPNNWRFEVQSRHALLASTSLGFTYRIDRNNLDGQQDTTRQVDLIGTNFSTSIKDKVNISAQFNYLNQHFRQPLVLAAAMNYMSSVSVTTNYKLFGFPQNTGLQINLYKINGYQGQTQLNHVGVDQSIRFENGKNTTTLAYFKTSLPTDTVSNETLLFQNNFSYKHKKMDASAGIKLAGSSKYGFQTGGFCGVNYSWTSQISTFFRAEKLILGDFYNTYDPERFARFPFYIQLSINYQFK